MRLKTKKRRWTDVVKLAAVAAIVVSGLGFAPWVEAADWERQSPEPAISCDFTVNSTSWGIWTKVTARYKVNSDPGSFIEYVCNWCTRDSCGTFEHECVVSGEGRGGRYEFSAGVRSISVGFPPIVSSQNKACGEIFEKARISVNNKQ